MMVQNQEAPLSPSSQPNTTPCPNCRSLMPAELRFCRNCGFRLGEGPAEYIETQRFQPGENGASAQQVFASTYGAGGDPAVRTHTQLKRRRRTMSGMTWMFLGLLIFFVAASTFTAIIGTRGRDGTEVNAPSTPRAYFGSSSFKTTEGGITFENVEPPGSPADMAGLLGGDVITSFDGFPVRTPDELSDLVRKTEIGKTVEVAYIRDGETATTKLTLMSKQEIDRLGREFRRRPEGHGQFGYDNGRSERVQVPNSSIYGVRLNRISQSRAADLAGVKQGDIVIEFDGIPIRTPGEFRSRVDRAVPYSKIKLVVIREGERVEIPMTMGKQ